MKGVLGFIVGFIGGPILVLIFIYIVLKFVA